MNCECGREINLSGDFLQGDHWTTLCPCGIKWQWHARGQQVTSQGAIRYSPGPCPGPGVCEQCDPEARNLPF